MKKENDMEIDFILSVDLSLGKDFKASVKNCMEFLEVIKKSTAATALLK